MIKFKKGLKFDFSERTWELMSDQAKAQFSDDGPTNIAVEQILLSKTDKQDIGNVQVIQLEEIKIEKPDEQKEVPVKKPRKTKAK